MVIEKLIGRMARKRNAPFLSGKIETWAAAVIHALGMVNFLFDQSTRPFVSVGDICGYFGTSQSTTTQKSKQIRDMFKMGYFDPEFSTASTAADDPLRNLVLVNGLLVPLDMLKGGHMALPRRRHKGLAAASTWVCAARPGSVAREHELCDAGLL
ncbi:MAG TPA: hypothetical protein GX513_09130 [Firmicutes bacterium]|nr:hypothetical protein [Bacillota bacterium]